MLRVTKPQPSHNSTVFLSLALLLTLLSPLCFVPDHRLHSADLTLRLSHDVAGSASARVAQRQRASDDDVAGLARECENEAVRVTTMSLARPVSQARRRAGDHGFDAVAIPHDRIDNDPPSLGHFNLDALGCLAGTDAHNLCPLPRVGILFERLGVITHE